MKVYLSADLLDVEDNFEHLDMVLHLLKKSQHELVFKNLNEIDRIDECKWVEGMRQYAGSFLAMLVENSFKKMAYEKTRESLAIVQNINNQYNNEFILADAVVYLQNPVYIMLENEHYDKFFLDALFLCFKTKSKKILSLLHNGSISLINAGGKGNIPNLIDEKLAFFQHCPLENHKYLRLFVLIDSDKKYPNMQSPNEYIIEKCNHHSIASHMLEKREMENYVPDIAFTTIDESVQDVAQAYLMLSGIQKDYYDVEKGFGVPIKQLEENVYSLYSDLKQDIYSNLRNGFHIDRFNSKQEVPKLFKNVNVTQETLISQCAHQDNPHELEVILEKINTLL